MYKVDGELTRRNRLRHDTMTKFEQIDVVLGYTEAKVKDFEMKLVNNISTMKKLAYTNTIQSALNIQDERDREWVSLFSNLEEKTGYYAIGDPDGPEAPNPNKPKSHFTLNQECISCSGNMGHNLNLFKVACLNYEPNPVFHGGHYIDRRELISLQHVIADKTQFLIDQND